MSTNQILFDFIIINLVINAATLLQQGFYKTIGMMSKRNSKRAGIYFLKISSQNFNHPDKQKKMPELTLQSTKHH